MKKTLVLAICVLLLGSTALADWDEGDPAKWVQLPDLSPTGMDVKAGNIIDPDGTAAPPMKKVLADDFECTTTEPITDIHIWGSWNNDVLPQPGTSEMVFPPDPGSVVFHLTIWSDIPAVAGGPEYSMPGQILWARDFSPGDFAVRQVNSPPEDWFDPNTQVWTDDSHDFAFQYNFLIPEADAYIQEGTPNAPIVYWLSVDAMPIGNPNQEVDPEFGWKTSQDHWNDDATYSDWVLDPGSGDWVPGPWLELIYPGIPGQTGHEFAGESIDLAFVITPEPTTMVLLGMGSLALIRRRRR